MGGVKWTPGWWSHRRDLLLVGEAIGWLWMAWIALRLIPFRRLARWLQPEPHGRTVDPAILSRIRWAVAAAAHRVPWRAVCFHRGIAAQRMLCRRGIPTELHYGVAKAPGGDLEAHVWVTAGEIVVTGGEVANRFTAMKVFGAKR